VAVASDLADALRRLGAEMYPLCLLDLTQDRAALTAIRLIRARYPGVALAGVTDATNPVLSAEAMSAGLVDLLPWPCDPGQVALLTANAREQGSADPASPPASAAGTALFAQSPSMRQLVAQIDAAPLGHHVILVGEPATGRSMAARALHLRSGAPADRFIRIDVATDAPHGFERRLFGAERDPRDPARPAGPERLPPDSDLLRAQGGTLYVRNLAEAPARVQARLARLLRDREVMVEGAVVALDVRVIASLGPDLEARVADGRLNADLVMRLSQVRLEIPPLRRRAEDIPLLAVHFARTVGAASGTPPKSFSRSAFALLSALPWQGNAHELLALVGILSRSVAGRVIQVSDVLEHAALDGFAARVETGGSLREARARFERECISATLLRHHGRVGEAARALGIQRTNLYRKVRQLNVSRTLLSSKR
jgi:DNA-binding NtrC family response regulator